MFKPLLASPAVEYIFPLFVSVKIDGIRCCIKPGAGAVSRQIKAIPNHYIRTILNSDPDLKYCDGELLTFTNGKMDSFNTVQSKVMSQSGMPEFAYYIFDHFQFPDAPYVNRREYIPQGRQHTKVVTQIEVHTQDEIDRIEAAALADNWEGLIARDIHGRYKFGRSTAKEGILLKVVRKQRAEGIIIGFKERQHNANSLEISNLGYAQRSSHKANLVGRDDLGSLDLVWDGIADGIQLAPNGTEFSVGTGFDDAARQSLWQDQANLIGRTVTFEFRGIGSENRPRFPAFIAIL